MALTPAQLAKSGSEHAHQQALFAAFALPEMQAMYPQLARCMFAIPNGGKRGANAREAQLNGAMMKAEGQKRGVCDIFVAVPRTKWHGLFLEMKVGHNNVSADQLAFINAVAEQGYAAVVCWGWEQAYATIRAYMDGFL